MYQIGVSCQPILWALKKRRKKKNPSLVLVGSCMRFSCGCFDRPLKKSVKKFRMPTTPYYLISTTPIRKKVVLNCTFPQKHMGNILNVEIETFCYLVKNIGSFRISSRQHGSKTVGATRGGENCTKEVEEVVQKKENLFLMGLFQYKWRLWN